ncbi:hypothetical protein pb186bvf_018376 [Paramecium bursaria]
MDTQEAQTLLLKILNKQVPDKPEIIPNLQQYFIDKEQTILNETLIGVSSNDIEITIDTLSKLGQMNQNHLLDHEYFVGLRNAIRIFLNIRLSNGQKFILKQINQIKFQIRDSVKILSKMEKNKLKEKQHILSQINQQELQLDLIRIPKKKIKYNSLIRQEPPSVKQIEPDDIDKIISINPQLITSSHQKKCYVCKQKFYQQHHFYGQLCMSCADISYSKRFQKCDLQGKIALVTGARIKIGAEIVLSLLRNGCFVIATTRFPIDAANRFQQEKDYNDWSDRLQIYQLDLQYVQNIYQFCNQLKQKYDKLDILINNAAQTIRRDQNYYQNLIQNENKMIIDQKVLALPYRPQQIIQQDNFITDINKEYVDLKPINSWIAEIDDISFQEFLEVQTINSTAPFILCQQLKPLLEQSPDKPRFIVNVSAMEGQFYKQFKSTTHPHTNMAKAALNMLTRTCGAYYAQSEIYMNSADTGWVSDEKPITCQSNNLVPLDEIDGAARVLDCIYQGYKGNAQHSKFFKDFKECFW